MNKIFLGYNFSLPWVREAFERACEGLAELEVASDKLRGQPLVEKIMHMIEQSDLAVFDLTTHNANVALEAGIAIRADHKFAITYCRDEKYRPRPDQESAVFSDLKGWDSILYRDAAELERELKRLLPEFLESKHVGRRTATSPSVEIWPRLYVTVGMIYPATIAVGSSPTVSLGDAKLSVELANRGKGAANQVRVQIGGFNYIDEIGTLPPGKAIVHKWPIEDQEAYRIAQFPAIKVEYFDDNHVFFEQVGALNYKRNGDGTIRYSGSELGPPKQIENYTIGLPLEDGHRTL